MVRGVAYWEDVTDDISLQGNASGVDTLPPEKLLVLAVFNTAIEDLKKYRPEALGIRRVKGARRYHEARDWVFSDDPAWPYSFVNLCNELGFVPSAIREQIIKDEKVCGISFGEEVTKYDVPKGNRYGFRKPQKVRNLKKDVPKKQNVPSSEDDWGDSDKGAFGDLSENQMYIIFGGFYEYKGNAYTTASKAGVAVTTVRRHWKEIGLDINDLEKLVG